jgi:hypothetical protein
MAHFDQKWAALYYVYTPIITMPLLHDAFHYVVQMFAGT